MVIEITEAGISLFNQYRRRIRLHSFSRLGNCLCDLDLALCP